MAHGSWPSDSSGEEGQVVCSAMLWGYGQMGKGGMEVVPKPPMMSTAGFSPLEAAPLAAASSAMAIQDGQMGGGEEGVVEAQARVCERSEGEKDKRKRRREEREERVDEEEVQAGVM